MRTCATFPRETVRSYDTDEKYIFLGCPKAAHLLFEVSGKITFMFERDPDLDMEDIPIYNHVMKINLTVRGKSQILFRSQNFHCGSGNFMGLIR